PSEDPRRIAHFRSQRDPNLRRVLHRAATDPEPEHRRQARSRAVYRAVTGGGPPRPLRNGPPLAAMRRLQTSGTKSYSPTPCRTRKVAECSPALVTRCGRLGATV